MLEPHAAISLPYLVQVCRTYNFGEVGSSKGMYYDTFLAPTRLNRDLVPWLDMDLSYLHLPRWAVCIMPSLACTLQPSLLLVRLQLMPLLAL